MDNSLPYDPYAVQYGADSVSPHFHFPSLSSVGAPPCPPYWVPPVAQSRLYCCRFLLALCRAASGPNGPFPPTPIPYRLNANVD